MVDVWVVRMRMDEFLVPVPVRMRLTRRVIRAVRVLVMLVVGVQVLVFHRFVSMFVAVAFSEMKPDAERHEQGGGNEANRHCVP